MNSTQPKKILMNSISQSQSNSTLPERYVHGQLPNVRKILRENLKFQTDQQVNIMEQDLSTNPTGLTRRILSQRPNLGQPAPFPTPYMVGRENKRTNNRTMFPTLKDNAAAGDKGLVKGTALSIIIIISQY